MSNEEWIQNLREEREIQSVLVRYCELIDSKEFAALAELFTEDAEIDYTKSGGIRGKLPEIQTWLAQALGPFLVVQHIVGNFRIEIDGDRASSVCSFFNPMGLPGEDGSVKTFFVGGEYRDQLVRTEAGWKIRERVNDQKYLHSGS